MFLFPETLESALERFEDRVKYFITSIDKTSISGDLYTLGLRKSSGKVVVDNLEDIPEDFKITKVTIDADKKKLKEALALGVDIKGARVEYEPTLMKKIKTT